jgi:hypothetical protein
MMMGRSDGEWKLTPRHSTQHQHHSVTGLLQIQLLELVVGPVAVEDREIVVNL